MTFKSDKDDIISILRSILHGNEGKVHFFNLYGSVRSMLTEEGQLEEYSIIMKEGIKKCEFNSILKTVGFVSFEELIDCFDEIIENLEHSKLQDCYNIIEGYTMFFAFPSVGLSV